MNKVVIGFTGNVETSLCIHLLKKKYNAKVVAFCANIGQEEYLEPIGERAIDIGADATYISDLREKFLSDFIIPSFKASARHQSGYLLSSALSRPLLVQELVRLADEEGAQTIAVGSSGRGNERARFEACLKAVAPHLKLIAPLEETGITSAAAIHATTEEAGMPFEPSKRFTYNIDRNLWGSCIDFTCEGDFSKELPEGIFVLTQNPEHAADAPVSLEVGFESGVFSEIDGERLPPAKIVQVLNRLGGRHGIGRLDVVERRLSGTMTREIYEAPAATILYAAHASLEQVVLSHELIATTQLLSRTYADLIYHGQWFSRLREALDAFTNKAQENVTGTVRLRLYKGSATPTVTRPSSRNQSA